MSESKITASEALVALDNLDDYARMETGIVAYGDIGVLVQFIKQHMGDEVLDEEGERALRFLDK